MWRKCNFPTQLTIPFSQKFNSNLEKKSFCHLIIEINCYFRHPWRCCVIWNWIVCAFRRRWWIHAAWVSERNTVPKQPEDKVCDSHRESYTPRAITLRNPSQLKAKIWAMRQSANTWRVGSNEYFNCEFRIAIFCQGRFSRCTVALVWLCNCKNINPFPLL